MHARYRALLRRAGASGALALVFALGVAGVASAAPATPPTVTIEAGPAGSCTAYTLTTLTCDSTSGVDGHGSYYRTAGYNPGATGTGGHTATVAISAGGWGVGGHADVSTCTGAGTGCTSIGSVSANGNLTYTVPTSTYWVLVNVAAITTDASAVRVAITAPGPNTILYPALDVTSISDNVGAFFGFLAPVLWLVGGISIGGLLLHKARGLM